MFLLTGCATTERTEEVETSGFLGDYSQLKKGEGERPLHYVNPNANIADYDKAIIDPVVIWHSKDSDLSKVPKEELENLSHYLYSAVRKQLESNYTIVEQPAKGTIRIRMALMEAEGSNVPLDIATTYLPPARLISETKKLATGTHAFVGETVIELEVLDSMSNERLIAVVDILIMAINNNTSLRVEQEPDEKEGSYMKLLRIVMICCFLAIWFGFPVAEAFAAEDVSGWHNGAVFAYKDGLLGPLGGKRAELSDHGVDVYLSALVIGQSIVKGGIEEKDKLSSSYDLHVYLDSSKLGLWKGGYGIVRAEGKAGLDGINRYTGAVIPANFDAVVPKLDDVGVLLTEWSYTQSFADGKVEALAGMYDIGRFYDIVPFSGPYPYRFLNSHMFFNSVILPYAPYNLLGGLVIARPTKWWTITTGISDPDSNADKVDWFSAGNFDLLHEWRFMARPFGKPGWYTAGIAYRDKEQATIEQDPTSRGTETNDSDWAFYANFNQWLYQNPKDPHRAIGVFGRLGVSDGEVNIIERHYSLGVSFDGMIPSRPRDIIGIVGWYNEFSDDLPDFEDDHSSGFEAYYSLHLPRGIRLSADVQYLIDPGLAEDSDDTLILGLRALVLF